MSERRRARLLGVFGACSFSAGFCTFGLACRGKSAEMGEAAGGAGAQESSDDASDQRDCGCAAGSARRGRAAPSSAGEAGHARNAGAGACVLSGVMYALSTELDGECCVECVKEENEKDGVVGDSG